MAWEDDLLELLFKGAIVLVVGSIVLAFIVIVLLVLAPFAVSMALLDYFHFGPERRKREAIESAERERKYWAERKIERERKEEERKQKEIHDEHLRFWQHMPPWTTWEEAEALYPQYKAGKSKDEIAEELRMQRLMPKKPELPKLKRTSESLSEDCYKESELNAKQREQMLAFGFKRLKVSPDGKSGAAFYWVHKRYNESTEHAFFCYLIADLLKKRGVRNVTLNVNDGPDLEFFFNRKKYCFEVETGSNLVRNPVYVFKKLAFNQQDFFKCFVFVTRKKFKYRYAKMADLVTRATLKQTIAQLGVDR